VGSFAWAPPPPGGIVVSILASYSEYPSLNWYNYKKAKINKKETGIGPIKKFLEIFLKTIHRSFHFFSRKSAWPQKAWAESEPSWEFAGGGLKSETPFSLFSFLFCPINFHPRVLGSSPLESPTEYFVVLHINDYSTANRKWVSIIMLYGFQSLNAYNCVALKDHFSNSCANSRDS